MYNYRYLVFLIALTCQTHYIQSRTIPLNKIY